MTSRLTAICLGAAMVLGVGAAAPAAAAALPVMKLEPGSASAAKLYKVHRFRGRWHCAPRWSPRRGWHRHRRACRGYYRPGPGWRWRGREGCWWHPRWGLRCRF